MFYRTLRSLFLFFLLIGLSFVLGGCAGKETLPRFVWPLPPDQPRFEYIGNYSSEADFEKSKSEQTLDSFLGRQGESIFLTPYGIATNGKGIVYVSDIHLKNVRIYDFNLRTVNFLVKGTEMVSPFGLAVDSQGNLYVADGGQNKILIFDSDHVLRNRISHVEELTRPAYLALNEELGRLYVADGLQNKIVVFSLAGKFLFSFGGTGDEPGKFFAPQGMAFGPDGNLYVADSLNARVQVLTPDGKPVRVFGERGDQPGQFESPKDLVFDSEGNLHVIEGRRSEIMTFTPEGKLLLVTGAGKASSSRFGFSAPRSIAIDAQDRIYVAEALNKRFSIWQYMSSAWLAKKPYTDVDRKSLIDYLTKMAKEKEGS